jgi:hypothetical protein
MMEVENKYISETEAKLMTHEEVCAQRYEAIKKSFEEGDKRMTKIEYLLYAVIVAVLFGPGVAAEFFKKLVGV